MPNDQKPTVDRLQDLLALLNITSVYYVDDENNLSDIDFQVISGEIEKIYGFNKQDALQAINFDGADWDMPKEGVISQFSSEWQTLPFEKKKEIYVEILKISGGEEIKLDFERAKRVQEQLPGGIVKIMSPQQWDTEKTKLNELIADGEMALVLFDEDLSHAGIKYQSTKGHNLIAQVKQSAANNKVICSLLTHKISSAREELGFRDSLIEENPEINLQVNDFFPLAKERLDNPEVFADGIKKTLLNKYFETIKQHTKALIKASYEDAAKRVDSFDTYDFDQTILQTSLREGVWVPETIIRIADIEFENKLKERMTKNDYVPIINEQLKYAEPFADIQFDIPSTMQPYSDKLLIRHAEIYDSGDIINKLRKPLENGDIFQIDQTKYILVAQPCDMMIRGMGKKKGIRNAKVATLLRIEELDYNKKKQPDLAKAKDQHLLEYFENGTNKFGLVHFNSYLIVDIDVLDLCVFNEKGEAVIHFGEPKIDVSYLSSCWETRFGFLSAQLDELRKKILSVKEMISSLPKDHQTVILDEFFPKAVIVASNPLVLPIIKNDNLTTLNFGITRVKHYKGTGAKTLLEKYTQHLSRTAELHDFAAGETKAVPAQAASGATIVKKKEENKVVAQEITTQTRPPRLN
ncbi:hypothetical protein [Flaviaesturariibacter aridisoli]|uniref:Uncharacterized protein n=1 Tax=Flaviaesturariibacter aridisoli TaxID=2545761 RepID=A0A4R4E5Z5_9BACT|nr:hypothetical protein [Flaviaesturariibacter aridisoli]TCZ73461.1 hypothetical protein E0486_05740 [Flaviaesturariibacter aridisoli]